MTLRVPEDGGQWGGSVHNGTCCTPEDQSPVPGTHGRRERAPARCPLTPTYISWHACAATPINKCKEQFKNPRIGCRAWLKEPLCLNKFSSFWGTYLVFPHPLLTMRQQKQDSCSLLALVCGSVRASQMKLCLHAPRQRNADPMGALLCKEKLCYETHPWSASFSRPRQLPTGH